MSEQRTFAGIAWTTKGKLTRRERFLSEMDQVIPWKRLMALIEPHYPKPGRGRRPLGLERMLRIYFLQQWFDLSDPGAEDAIYDSESMRRFRAGQSVSRPEAIGSAWGVVSAPRTRNATSGAETGVGNPYSGVNGLGSAGCVPFNLPGRACSEVPYGDRRIHALPVRKG